MVAILDLLGRDWRRRQDVAHAATVSAAIRDGDAPRTLAGGGATRRGHHVEHDRVLGLVLVLLLVRVLGPRRREEQLGAGLAKLVAASVRAEVRVEVFGRDVDALAAAAESVRTVSLSYAQDIGDDIGTARAQVLADPDLARSRAERIIQLAEALVRRHGRQERR